MISKNSRQEFVVHLVIEKLQKIILCVFIPIIGYSQNDTVSKKQKFLFGINAGFNSSKISCDTIPFHYGTKPEIGLYANFALFKAIYLKNAVQYSVKGSSCAAPYVKFENHYLDMNLIPEFQFSKDFYLQCGAGYSQFIFSKRVRTSAETRNGVKRMDNGKFISEINIVSGIEFKLQKNSNLQFNYFIPTSKKGTKNFQLSLNILLNNKSKKERYNKTNKNRSKEQIAQLKNGTLLVRLKTSENKINALLKSGKMEEANAVRQHQESENKKIVFAFRHYYTYSNVLFFYNTKSDQIRKKEFAGIFLNDSLSLDSTVVIDKNKPLFIAEFGSIEQDTARYFSYTTYEPEGNGNLEIQNHYYGGPNPGFDALVIRDEKFIQLKKPFPYYTRVLFNSVKQHPEQVVFLSIPLPILLFQTWSYNKTVKRMNTELLNYYKKVSKK